MSRNALLTRFPPEHHRSHRRLDFNLVILAPTMAGSHEVDFLTTSIKPNQALHIEPGQVHRWCPQDDFDATLVLFRSGVGLINRGWRIGTTAFDLDEKQAQSVGVVLELINEELDADRSAAARRRMLEALRDMFFIRMGLDRAAQERDDLPAAYLALRDDLERDLSITPTMAERGQRVGYSARTISRACMTVTGRTAKQIVDDRLVLEARRLLAEAGATSAQVGATLGFSEPTNFTKYFRRHTGKTPSEWAASLR